MSIHRLSISDLAHKLANKDLSSFEIVDALLCRADIVEPRVRGFVHRFGERALEEAKLADEARARGEPLGPLHGLPLSVKESIATRGLDVTLGVRSRRGRAAEDDAVVVKILRRAGAILIGKTNISQTLLFHEADNPIWGRTHNPWNLDRVPGGSSGGEAAVIASGASAGGIGTDIGGSVRIPAAFCGIAGLKPTLDRWSNVGCVSAMAGQELIRSQCGPMARTARDVAFLFRAIDSPIHSVFDPSVPPMITPDPARTAVNLLRVGFYDDDRFLTPAASVRRGVAIAVRAAAAAGARTVPFELPNAVELTYLYFAALSSDGGKTLDRLLEGDAVVPQLRSLRMVAKAPALVRTVLAAFFASQGEARIERLLQVVHEKPVCDFWAIAHQRTQLRLEMIEAWDRAGIDALICPVHATPALRHGQSRDFSLAGSYSMHYNLLNFPAGVVPVSRVQAEDTKRREPTDRLDRTAAEVERDSVGLPVAVQIVARPYREDIVLALMIAIEDAARRLPDFPVSPVDV